MCLINNKNIYSIIRISIQKPMKTFLGKNKNIGFIIYNIFLRRYCCYISLSL